MKHLFKNSVIVILLFGITANFPSCLKDVNLPLVATTNISDITETYALIEGSVRDDGGDEISETGFCWDTSPYPETGSQKIINVSVSNSFSGYITGLTSDTRYHVRAYATNSAGTSYGNEFTFTTIGKPLASSVIFNPNLSYGTISDLEANQYKTIQIGNQTWMAENLRSTRLNDGTFIPNVRFTAQWAYLKNPGYCWYNNDASAHTADYGALYNWYAINSNKLCPAGWHVPTDAEWITLLSYLGGGVTADSKLMETGSVHWLNPNTETTNSSGFTALPGGFRFVDWDDFDIDFFTDLGYEASWWTASEFRGTDFAWVADIDSRNSESKGGVDIIRSKNSGSSVRCVKDE